MKENLNNSSVGKANFDHLTDVQIMIVLSCIPILRCLHIMVQFAQRWMHLFVIIWLQFYNVTHWPIIGNYFHV